MTRSVTHGRERAAQRKQASVPTKVSPPRWYRAEPIELEPAMPTTTIQWYPGHMTKARREIAEAMRVHDVVVEVLDARMPGASENPVLAELRRHKPCIKVLCKSDLADPNATQSWIRWF